MLTKQETNPQPSTSNAKESTAQSKNVLVKPSPEKTVEETEIFRAVEVPMVTGKKKR
ncbi:hypothetical protein ANCCAN_25348 [Ancylostoma caninum]|uniref:Uncharacterized protein n=1 Tax=Ancylostoma caninum TaxID=29170 RepID=A0A368FDN9_ANCCA|nr:hypothetical protein ANCCAN_25348 [Ancylostoma caninum]